MAPAAPAGPTASLQIQPLGKESYWKIVDSNRASRSMCWFKNLGGDEGGQGVQRYPQWI
jgi:hypothetical protein